MRQRPLLRHPEVVLVRCLLVDDSRTFLETAGSLLDRDGVAVVGSASSIAEALSQVSTLSPDVAVVDIGLGGENGFDLADPLAGQGIAVVMTSTGPEADYADLIAASPVAGFVPKADLSAPRIRRLLSAIPRPPSGHRGA